MIDLVLHIVSRDKKLRYHVIVLGKLLIIYVHQFALADCCCRLLGRNIGRALLERQFADAHADCAGRNQNYFVACIFQVTQHAAQLFHSANIYMTGLMCQGRSADLYDDTHNCSTS